MNQKPTGSPIIAREFFPFAKYFLLIIFILAVIVLVWFIFLKFSKYKETPKYLEKKKKRKPSKVEIKNFCSKYNFSKDQRKVFTYIAKNLKNENLIYSIKDDVRLNEIFCEFYKRLSSEKNEKQIYALFSLLFKIEQINSHKAKITSSHKIPVSTVINYVSEKKEIHPFVLIKNTDNFLIFEISQSFYSDENKPKVLDKLYFIFKSSSGLTYYFSTRVINYEKTEDDKFTLITSHPQDFTQKAQRTSKRKNTEEKCDFYFAKLTDVKNNIFSISEKQNEGILLNISEGGCCIKTELAIKENQNILIHLPFLQTDEQIIGIIKHTRKFTDKTFALHIQFINLSIKTKNLILSYVYNFLK